jgi:RNase P subunit RPR2
MGIFNKLKNASQVNLKKTLCPECGTIQPRVRKPKNFRQALWGGNTCENCGCEMDRFGNRL